LSSKQRKKTPKPKAALKEEVAPRRPVGKPLVAMVSSRNGTEMVEREGRGFSLGELQKAGWEPRLARDWGYRIDSRRRSVLDSNVSALATKSGAMAAPKKREGEIREDIERVEKAIEKEAEELKEEVVKVEKAAKKEVAKAEKVVKAKVEKPKPKPKSKKKAES